MNDIYSTIVKFFQEGGFFIYPISIVLAIGLAIALERWFFLTRERIRNSRAFEDFLPLLRTTDMSKMQLYSREVQTPVTRIIGCGLDMMKVSKQRADVENSMTEGMLETMPKLEQRTGYLAVLANVATLLGLLGTIVGLIGAFTAVANADPAEKSQLLSLSISVAMNTTAFGLIAAIPLLILHAVLQNKTAKIVAGIEMSAVKFLNIMTLHRLIEAGTPRHDEPRFSDTKSGKPGRAAAESSPAHSTPAQAQAAYAPATPSHTSVAAAPAAAAATTYAAAPAAPTATATPAPTPAPTPTPTHAIPAVDPAQVAAAAQAPAAAPQPAAVQAEPAPAEPAPAEPAQPHTTLAERLAAQNPLPVEEQPSSSAPDADNGPADPAPAT